MLTREGDDPADRFGCHALEYLGGDLLGRMVIGIFENGPNGEARALYQPRTGRLAGNAFNLGALAPIDHSGLHRRQVYHG